MNFMTAKEAALKWNISERRVRTLCSQGRINEATHMGWVWSIPENAAKPEDARIVKQIKDNRLAVESGHVDFYEIDGKKKRLDSFRPLPEHILDSLRERLILEWTFNSNAMEGNTLTIGEMKVVLEGVTVGGKSVREHLEVINHRDAVLFLEELISKKEPLSEWNIKNIHQLILKNIDNENAGRYREENARISGAEHKPPEPFLVPEQMQRLVAVYNGEWRKLHPVERVALLHGEFDRIHPFTDANGKTARLLMNFELMKNGYPPAVIQEQMRSKYRDALDLAHTTGRYDDFTKLVARCEESSLDLYLNGFGE